MWHRHWEVTLGHSTRIQEKVRSNGGRNLQVCELDVFHELSFGGFKSVFQGHFKANNFLSDNGGPFSMSQMVTAGIYLMFTYD